MSGSGIRTHKEVRTDIQALRGFAILLVLLHHAHVPGVPGGFLGVDIFFVISGYLITTLLVEEIETSHFSWRAFYERRIRRLFPAAYATLIATALLAPLFLDSIEYHNLIWQLLGSFTFTANVVLWRQSDYFGSDAALKPLLHMWSLSVEEQFYIVLPPLLLLCRARLRLALIALLALGSAALCLLLLQKAPSAAFYLLPTRAWELGLGSLLAIALRRGVLRPRTLVGLRIACAMMLAAIPILADERGHPGLAAAGVCAATAGLLLPGAQLGALTRGLAPLAWLGNRSYSLYLVHWPVFAFANNVSLVPLNLASNLVLLALCFVWAELQYRFVEERFRRTPLTRKRLLGFAVAPAAVLLMGVVAAQSRVSHVTEARAGNHGLSRACDFRGDFEPIPACQDRADPKVLVWGDSFAMALVEGMASTGTGVRQATRTVCGPFLGIAPTNGAQYPRAWAESCRSFNSSVLAHIANEPGLRTIVLSSALVQYLPGAEPRQPWQLVAADGEEELSVEKLLAALEHTVRAVRALGRDVVLFAPPPASGFDVARCADRLENGLLTLPERSGCAFARADYEEYRRPTLAFLAAVERRNLLPVVRFDDTLCHDGNCTALLNGVLLYQDATHLSRTGSRLLAEKMGWRGSLLPDARRSQ